MTNRKQERIAKIALEILLDAWCSVDGRHEDSMDNNCHHCEFQTNDGLCLAKKFKVTEHFPERYPQGCLTREVRDED